MREVYFYSMTINAIHLSYYCTSPYSMCTYVPTYISESTENILYMEVAKVLH